MNTITPSHPEHPERRHEHEHRRLRPDRRSNPLFIPVASGFASGPNKLVAFHFALKQAGVENYNLLRLSSVIPAGSEVATVDRVTSHDNKNLSGSHGDRLYVVEAERREATPGVEAWAGIGWVQNSETGAGYFVEHDGSEEEDVREQIVDSLGAIAAISDIETGPMNMKLEGGRCLDKPVCALVIAAYQTSGWDGRS